MRKKILCLSILLCCLFSYYTPVNALNKNVNIEYLADGSYYETTIQEYRNLENIYSTRSSYTKKAEKSVKYVDSNGTIRWKVSVIGSFTYNYSSSTCTKADVTATSYDNNWTIANKSSSKSGNTATATATAKNYYNGHLIATVTKNVSLKCSKSGILS